MRIFIDSNVLISGIVFDSAESALRDHDSANIVKLQISTFCRALHH